MEYIELNTIDQVEPVSGMKARFVHTETNSYAFWEIQEGAILPEHNHVHEQVAIVTKGELELRVNGVPQVLKPGMVAVIPSNAFHSARALSYCEMTDVFSPVREDFK